MRSRTDDVVITGIGCVGPLGQTAETTWQRLLAGEVGVRQLNFADLHGLPYDDRTASTLVGAPAALHELSHELDPTLSLIETATDEAWSSAGLTVDAFDPDRAATVIGTSKGGLVAFAEAFRGRLDRWSDVPIHVASSRTAKRYDLRGPCLAPVAACATGLVCILRAADLLSSGACDLVVAGSGDASLHPAVLGSFRRMGVLSSRFDEPSAACRPFNADRDGFAVGEGAGMFVLERRKQALARGAQPIATLMGGALLADPSGLTAVDTRGTTLARAIGDALQWAELRPTEVGHVNLHGTATRTNDISEAAGLRAAFGAYTDRLSCVALKGALGHQLGAAGAVELAMTALSIRDGRQPPTANLTEPDPACTLPLSTTVNSVQGCALKISLGFGGHVAVALLGPPEQQL